MFNSQQKPKYVRRERLADKFAKLMLDYETDETKLKEIKDILDSDRMSEHLFDTSIGFNALHFSVENKLKIKKILFEHVIPEGCVEYEEICHAIFYNDIEIVKFALESYSVRLNLSYDEISSPICSTVFKVGTPEIIDLFLDHYDICDILEIKWKGGRSVYEVIFTDLQPERRDTVVDHLIRHQYYGPIIRKQAICIFKRICTVFPCLTNPEEINREDMNYYYRPEITKDFRKKCLPEISNKVTEIKLAPGSMEMKAAKYRNELLQKFGTNNIDEMSEEQKKEYYDRISEDIKFCEHYSLKSKDDLYRLEHLF